MIRIALLATALSGLTAIPAGAASFDCAKASAPDEIAICRNPVLSERDTEMAALWFAYSKIPMMMGGNGNRHDAARDFLAQRAACGGNVACLQSAYDARIATLKSDIPAALGNACNNP
ncbi:hypothetical protein K32_11810 [Kaistia sp. 32K]|uniref:lysozyme inhibitor LprI family protein n=1 Tax=Kaistia sp. 32K TaxID=2795690 RepID=UPI001915365B|nr:hypothetical protein [Kaistia sp. 32K]BCP52564.1 hypothetical protein K32_11810 [Kaistia sp. 32K]